MRLLKFLPVVSAALLMLAAPSEAADPEGAVRLPGKRLKVVSGVRCGLVRGSWEPGRIVRGGRFYSDAAERGDLLREARSSRPKKRRSLQKEADDIRAGLAARRAACRAGGNGPVSFDLTGAVSLALVPSSGAASVRTTTGTLMKVTAAGELERVMNSRAPSVAGFIIAPNDKLYVAFGEKATVNGVEGCLLAEVDPDAKTQRCIENELISIDWRTDAFLNDPLQFDSTGAIYYSGQKPDLTRAFRKFLNGQLTELSNESMLVSDFIVLPDGRIVLRGLTVPDYPWIRRLSSDGALENLFHGWGQWLLRFPDGNLYFAEEDGVPGVRRYMTATDSVDERPWIGSGSGDNPYCDADAICGGQPVNGFCGKQGATIKAYHHTLSGKTFVITGYASPNALVQYYPVVQPVETRVSQPNVLHGVMNFLFVAGLDESGNNIVTSINTETGEERVRIAADAGIEVYHLSFSAPHNELLFDGLRFSDNKYVVGKISLTTGRIISSPTGSTRLMDLRALR